MDILRCALRVVAIFGITVALSGCAAFTHYNYKRSDLSGAGDAVFADAKQRAVLSAPRPEQTLDLLNKYRDKAIIRSDHALTAAARAQNPKVSKAWMKEARYYKQYARKIAQSIVTGRFQRSDLGVVAMCAEPSPDALSAVAASGGLMAEVFGKGKGQLQAAIAESAGSIGLRTQSIQLMRDAMYRLCEGYMNGALGNAAFETLHRRFQNSMVAILAIEQLTGAVRAQPVALSTNAQTGALKELAQVTKQLEETRASHTKADKDAKSARETATKKKDEIEKKSKEFADEKAKINKDDECKKIPAAEQAEKCEAPAPLSGGDRTAIESDLKKRQDEIDAANKEHTTLDTDAKNKEANASQLKANVEKLERVADALRQGQSVASATASYGKDPNCCGKMDPATAYFVTNSVENIVQSFYDQSYIDEVCTTLFTSAADDELGEQAVDDLLDTFEFDYETYDNVNDVRSMTRKSGRATIYALCKSHIAGDTRKRLDDAEKLLRNALDIEQKAMGKIEKAEQREDHLHSRVTQLQEQLRQRNKNITEKDNKILEQNAIIARQNASILTGAETLDYVDGLGDFVARIDAERAKLGAEREKCENAYKSSDGRGLNRPKKQIYDACVGAVDAVAAALELKVPEPDVLESRTLQIVRDDGEIVLRSSLPDVKTNSDIDDEIGGDPEPLDPDDPEVNRELGDTVTTPTEE